MSEPFRPPNLALATLSLSLATFMQVLDTTIANVSLPTIAGNLGVSANQSTWVITSFAVSNAIALPLTGFMTRRFGETRLFVWSTLLFSLASFLCGTAQTMSMLILFRALQGAVAGPMYPITQSLLISIYPPHKRGMALALFAMVTVVAPIAGPILGGWITDDYTWPWIFFINVPIGIFASLTVASQMKGRVEPTSRPKVDYVGLITLVIGVGTLQVVLDKGNDEDWFNSTFIVEMAIVSAIAIAVFLIWELTDKEPIVNLRLFRHRNFSMGTLALVLGYAAFFAINVLVPQWLQRNLGYTATWAGFATAPLGILPVILTPFVGRYAPRFDLRALAGFAFLVLGGTCLMRSYFYIGIDFRHVALVQLLQGLGVAFFFAPVLTILLSDLAPTEIADGAGLATFLRTLGASFAASLTNFLWDHRAIVHHERLGEHVTVYDPSTVAAMSDLGGKQDAIAMINQTITQQAYQLSFNEVFHLLGWIFLALIAVVWLAKPPFEPKAGMASGGH
ncbi:DHA2 family efflux MFS transporter permease subunit [Dyella sp. C11]|uniref:DHA2 family efflux MFS transporter permease subunit n=1 Tax=Dyella sp. C11 TaxID=2126991 RepID=UPI000D65EF32|nr:DHA2 family efflux MFS transporter permease subunit [Dyella sp. C11]